MGNLTVEVSKSIWAGPSPRDQGVGLQGPRGSKGVGLQKDLHLGEPYGGRGRRAIANVIDLEVVFWKPLHNVIGNVIYIKI